MDNIFECSLYVVDNPTATFNDKMTKQEKIKAAINSSDCNFGPGITGLICPIGRMDIICKKTIPIVKKNRVNYAREILTGIKVPIIGECGYILNGPVFGKVNKPYYVETTLGTLEDLKICLLSIPNGICSLLTPDKLNEYIAEHMDEDGTFNTYKKQLEEIIENSIQQFENIKITEYNINEDINSIYKEIKRARRR